MKGIPAHYGCSCRVRGAEGQARKLHRAATYSTEVEAELLVEGSDYAPESCARTAERGYWEE